MSKVLEKFDSWLLWQDARMWSRDAHPSWEYIATKASSQELREIYRNKILEAYKNEVEHN